MTELVTIRTVMELGILDKIPADGISLTELVKETGVQESLLGRLTFRPETPAEEFRTNASLDRRNGLHCTAG